MDKMQYLVKDIKYEEIIYMYNISYKKTIIYSIFKATLIFSRNLIFKKEKIKNLKIFISDLFNKYMKFYENFL